MFTGTRCRGAWSTLAKCTSWVETSTNLLVKVPDSVEVLSETPVPVLGRELKDELDGELVRLELAELEEDSEELGKGGG